MCTEKRTTIKEFIMNKCVLLFAVCFLFSVGLIACTGGEDPDRPIGTADFDTVCKGEGLTKGASYNAEASGVHRISVMTDSTIGAQYEEYFPQYLSQLPEEWFPQIVDGTFSYADVELTGCIHRVDVTPVEACEFEDEYTLNVHQATYELTVRTTQTGEILASETIEVEASCPTMHMFTDGEFEEDYFPVVDEETIQAFIQPYVAP
jgi:hypothetical protein